MLVSLLLSSAPALAQDAPEGEQEAPSSSASATTATAADASAPTEEVTVIGKTIDNGSSATTFAVDEIARLPGGSGDLLSAIQIVSGVAPPQQNSFGPEQGYYIRGSNLADNQYLIDWLPVGYIFHYGGSLSYSVVNSSLIESFDLVLGGFAPKYGSVVGGVIDVRLRKPLDDRIHTEFKVGTEVGVLVEGPIDEDSSFWFAARRSYLDLILANVDFGDGDAQITQFPKFYDIQTRFHTETDDGFVDFTIIQSDDQIGIIFNETDDPSFMGQLESTRDFLVAGVRWVANVGGWYQSQQYVSFLQNNSYISLGTQTTLDPNPGEPFGIESASDTLSVFSSHEFYLSDNHQFLVGLGYYRTATNTKGYLTAPPSNDSGSVFVSLATAQKTFGNEDLDATNLEPFYTYTYSDDAVLFSFGSRGINVALSNNLTSNRTYRYSGNSGRYRLEFPFADGSAKAYLLYGDYLQLQQDIYLTESFGNPGLVELISSRHRVIGFSGTNEYDWYWKVDLWDKDTYNQAIQPESGCIRCGTSTGSGIAYGIDIEFRKTFSSESSIYIAVSRSKGTRKNSPSEPSYPHSGDQPNSFNVAFSDSIAENSNWGWGMRTILHDGQPYTRVIGVRDPVNLTINGEAVPFHEPIFEPFNNSRLPLFFQLDLSFYHQDPDSNWTYKIEINSISDLFRENVAEYDYGENYQDYQNPKPESERFFLPTFVITGKF